MARTLKISIELPDDVSVEAVRLAEQQARETAVATLQQQGELSIPLPAGRCGPPGSPGRPGGPLGGSGSAQGQEAVSLGRRKRNIFLLTLLASCVTKYANL